MPRRVSLNLAFAGRWCDRTCQQVFLGCIRYPLSNFVCAIVYLPIGKTGSFNVKGIACTNPSTIHHFYMLSVNVLRAQQSNDTAAQFLSSAYRTGEGTSRYLRSLIHHMWGIYNETGGGREAWLPTLYLTQPIGKLTINTRRT